MFTLVRGSTALRFAKWAIAVMALSATLSHAGNEQLFTSENQQTTLIELFTSQGCSSCPPAERWLGGLKDDPRLWKEIVPVAFHVDYWDYIGWKDIYADPEYSARQRRYRAERAINSVYTPGFVVNGREWRGWFNKKSLAVAKNTAGKLRVSIDKRQLKATYTTGQADRSLTLNIALLGVGLQVDVERGENSGRRLPQDFTVLEFISVASPDGRWSNELPETRVSGNSRPAIAVWVSDGKNQQPLQAVGGWLKPGSW